MDHEIYGTIETNHERSSQIMTLKAYTNTIIGRAVWSIVLCLIAGGGLAVALTNSLHSNIQTSVFVFLYFILAFLIEASASAFYFKYYCRQRSLYNLRGLNQRDSQISCLLLVIRTVWTIVFGVYLIVQIYEEGPAIKKNHYEATYEQLRVMIATMIAGTVVSILAFIVGLIYQPVDW